MSINYPCDGKEISTSWAVWLHYERASEHHITSQAKKDSRSQVELGGLLWADIWLGLHSMELDGRAGGIMHSLAAR